MKIELLAPTEAAEPPSGKARGNATLDLAAKTISVRTINLPVPSALGDFDGYQMQVIVPGRETIYFPLSPGREIPLNYYGSGALQVDARAANTRIRIRPWKAESGDWGPVVLAGTFRECFY